MQKFVKNNRICLCKQKFFTTFAPDYVKTECNYSTGRL